MKETCVVYLCGPVSAAKGEEGKAPVPVPNVPLYAVSAHLDRAGAHAAVERCMGARIAQDVLDGYCYRWLPAVAVDGIGLGSRPDGKSLKQVIAEAS